MTLSVRLILFFMLGFNIVYAQFEKLYPLSYNAALAGHQNVQKSTYIYNNIVIIPDTLQLPFIEDFSEKTLLPYNFAQTSVNDTINFAIGACIDDRFDKKTGAFMLNQSYKYFFDTMIDQIDSIALSAITINVYNDSTNCFPVISNTFQVYPQPYIYTFDTLTGLPLDSTPMLADTIVNYATIYYANISPKLKWLDNYAYINTTFPINPLTIGVATLDGLNEQGLPYNNTVVNAYGDADVLTSKPIDLSGLHNDSAVLLSFFVQAEGLGDVPNMNDSLVLEFKNEYEDEWINVWSTTTAQHPAGNFKQYYVAVRDTNLVTGPRYFYEDFQFRFRNKASISGNNDQWNIDYIRLDKGRILTEIDTVIRDVAFMYDFPNVLENYTTLPWSQFQAGADEFADSLTIPIRDNGQVNGQSAGAFPIEILVVDSPNLDTIYNLNGVNFNPTSEIKNQIITPISEFVKPIYQADTVFVNSRAVISPTARNLLSINDTITSQIEFNKVMAYDDGSAERAYGIDGSPNELKKFAYKFNVAHPDTLAGIQIHFTNIDQNVDDLIFNLYAWDSIQVGVPLSFENVIGSIENLKPEYIEVVNGFYTFHFDTPILVTGTFYIGFSQLDSRNIQIGFDRNSIKGKQNMFVYTNSTWNPSFLVTQGSPMIRALLDAEYDFTSSIKDVFNKSSYIKVYPNPTTNKVQIEIPKEITKYSVELYDLSGRLIQLQENLDILDLSNYPTGMYLLNVKTKGNTYFNKIVKQ